MKGWAVSLACALLAAGCFTPEDPRVGGLEADVEALQIAVGALQTERDGLLERLERLERNVEGVGFHRLSWRIVSRTLHNPDVRAVPLTGGRTRIDVVFAFRARRCPRSIRTKVFAWTDADPNAPTLEVDQRFDLSESCSVTALSEEPWFLIDRVEFAD